MSAVLIRRTLDRVKPGSEMLLYEALPRIHKFSYEFDGEASALVHQVMALFLKNTPELGLWVARRDGIVVGHLLAMLSQWDGKMVAWVNQAKVDERESHPDYIKAQIDALDDWVVEANQWYAQHNIPVVIREQMMQTPWIDRAEAWARGFGFQPHRLLCRREARRR